MRGLRKVIDLGALDRVYAVAFDRITRNMHDAVVLLDGERQTPLSVGR